MVRILFIDDDESDHRTIRVVLSRRFEIVSHYRGILALDAVREVQPDLVLLDLSMPDIDGLTVLRGLSALDHAPPVVVLSGLTDTRVVVQAMRLGAVDYVVKPFRLKDLEASIRYAVVLGARRREPVYEDESLGEVPFLGSSQAVQKLRRSIRKFSVSEVPILICGESGTGKDLVARGIHTTSGRSTGPFVAINCAAIPHTIFESEMFGTERGAFTDAVPHPGRFEAAHHGTIFLDEVGEMDSQNQAKVLRAVEEGTVRRVGGNNSRAIDVRIVSATNRSPSRMIEEGGFRRDLYYRLSTVILEVPPLRERREDIPVLAGFFLKNGAGGTKTCSRGALERLTEHQWPGNVRELKNCVERAALLAEDEVIHSQDIVIY